MKVERGDSIYRQGKKLVVEGEAGKRVRISDGSKNTVLRNVAKLFGLGMSAEVARRILEIGTTIKLP